ncbi:hypothetical protein GPECTOR_12g607 [Gonium pectorale]|uniref:PPIase cyclophilin-type domain-containing protein n=1 Tax=Gonium pectorale TaxID=33097 RepID=A0A150GP81_GONPE|nr:hypothetical protein GPECTOR_12g607 [Gonium pectorale]|eukprot:KXZ51643.1 hypothetical protein GPECTOR_12g607 [Gonium pectorale]
MSRCRIRIWSPFPLCRVILTQPPFLNPICPNAALLRHGLRTFPSVQSWHISSTRGGSGERLPSNHHVRAVEGGVVAVSLDGSEFAIALDRALDLDRTHQVVGRIHKGKEILATLGDLRTLPDDSPQQRVTVARSGPTNHLGVHEDLDQGAAAGPPKDLGTRLAEASEAARSSVLEALSEGLKRKRKPGGAADEAEDGEEGAEDSGVAAADGNADAAADAGASPSTSGRPAAAAAKAAGPAAKGGSGVAAAAAAAAAAKSRNVKARMLDSMLGDLEGGSEDSDSSSGGRGDEGGD